MSQTTGSAEESTTPPTPRVDRFSLLPNELLDPIFESAYPTHPPEFPLSKHLYPFFEQRFYRKAYFFSPHSVKLFLETISAHPERGKSVKSLEFDRYRDDVVSFDILENLLPLLPNLVHLEINAGSASIDARWGLLFSTLSNLESVSIETRENENRVVHLNQFAFLAALTSLTTLKLYHWPFDAHVTFEEKEEEEEESFELQHLQHLHIKGDGAAEDSIKALVELCPTLISVDLASTRGIGSTSYTDALETLPSTLQALKLGSDLAIRGSQDAVLRRFNRLRFLDLDKRCYSTELHQTLALLPLLVEIRLGEGIVSPLDWVPLVCGTTRLVNLKKITFDFKVGKRGQTTNFETFEDVEGMKDWGLSDDLLKGAGAHVEFIANLRKFISMAESNGVKVGGTVHEALAIFEDFWIEGNNRVVAGLYAGFDWLNRLEDIRDGAFYASITLPSFDIEALEALDPDRLKLVKIDLPERNWYMYGLKDGGGL